jgi:L-seryl-tRNA(Ser) seleniumtransferase
MLDVNKDFVQLKPLLDGSGAWIASQFGAEAARVTPGAAAAIMLGTAACLAGQDGDKSEQLPDLTGMKSRVLIQSVHRYKYDRQATMSGAKLTEYGGSQGNAAAQLEEALAANDVAMILHPIHLDEVEGSLRLEDVVKIARPHGVPVFVDAAYMVYPTNLMATYIERGADLVAISSKYYGGPNAGGFIMGRADLVKAVSNVHFTAYESGTTLKYGRPLKMDRHTIVAVCVALEEWLNLDHDARHRHYDRQVQVLKQDISDIAGLTSAPKCFTMDERFIDEPVNALLITVDAAKTGKSAQAIADALFDQQPCIAVIQEDDKIGVVMDVLTDSEVIKIGEAIRNAL